MSNTSLINTRVGDMGRTRSRFTRAPRQGAMLESLESRMLLSSALLVSDITGTWALSGQDKSGSLTFDGGGSITAGTWASEGGPPTTMVVSGVGSTFTVQPGGGITIDLTTQPTGGGLSGNATMVGGVNGTKDVMALNEETMIGSVTTVGGLDLAVNHNGVFSLADAAGRWTIGAEDFHGSLVVDASGHVVRGSITAGDHGHVLQITGGTLALNADGTGTLTFTTRLHHHDNPALGSISLAITMDNSKDVIIGNSATLGDGSTHSDLAVLVKSNHNFRRSDIEGTTWTIAGENGNGSLTLNVHNILTGSMTMADGSIVQLHGTYSLGGNGKVVMNVFFGNGHGQGHGHGVTRFTLFGSINDSGNTIVLDQAAGNPHNPSPGLIVLVSNGNHAPTERPAVVLALPAVQTSLTVDFNTLLSTTRAKDADGDTLSFVITSVSTKGTLTITHNGVTTAVTAGVTTMVAGDTLSWTPNAGVTGKVQAFTVDATDGLALAADPTKVFVNVM